MLYKETEGAWGAKLSEVGDVSTRTPRSHSQPHCGGGGRPAQTVFGDKYRILLR